MDLKSEATEEYLEALYKIREAGFTRQVDLARHLGLTPASISGMVKKMIDIDLVKREGSDLVLTDRGELAALAIVRKHRLSERFLTDFLSLPWEQVHDEACKFEHVISGAVEDRLEDLLENPRSCPHGHPIPDKNGVIREEPSKPLSEFRASDSVVVVKVFEDDPEMLKFMSTLGLLPNVRLVIEEVGTAQYALGRKVTLEAHGLSATLERQDEAGPLRLTRERHSLATAITDEVQTRNDKVGLSWGERLWRYTTAPVSGLAILGLTLSFIFFFMFHIGTILAENFSAGWAIVASPVIDWFIALIAGETIVAAILDWGFDAGIEATLAVGIPYVLTFYFMLALLEDSGYLNSVAFLTDRLMHRFGLHGRAMIPLVAGLGCNVPAIVGTRVLATERERIVASTLITLVPCSARTGDASFPGSLPPNSR